MGGVEKNAKKENSKNVKKKFYCLKQISKCDTCFYIHLSRDFQKYRFRSVFIEKFWTILNFYTDRTFYSPVPYLMHKKMYKKSLKFQVIKSQKVSR